MDCCNSFLFLNMIVTICVTGAGTMGRGIALVCAQNGFATFLFDLNNDILEAARIHIHDQVDLLVKKEKISADEAVLIWNRLKFIFNIKDCLADLFIEAIVEDTAAKIALFNQLAAFNKPGVIFATNTSSLSVSLIQQGIAGGQRIAGMHFFNPAPVMKLVEVVSGDETSEDTIRELVDLCKKLGKIAVVCKDSPGFIVNRVARLYYLEAMKLVELGIASIEDIDTVMEVSGFKMGPFRLMDLIGLDINLAVSKSIYEAFNLEPRFQPPVLQEQKVSRGELGRKTGYGFYDYLP